GTTLYTALQKPLGKEARENARVLLVPTTQRVRETVEHSRYLNVPLEVSGLTVWGGDGIKKYDGTARPTTRPDPATTRPHRWGWDK
ncbi:MAG TPA: hypothetical protein VEI97_13780, partial [bacterium]|nr:hypothetical protein [bacterium]